MTERRHDREFVWMFLALPMAIEGEDDFAKMFRRAADFRGMQMPDVWVPDNENVTAPSMRDGGAESIVEVTSEQGAEFPDEIRPQIVWHRDSPETQYQDFQYMPDITDPERRAVEHIHGFIIPEVSGVGDWKRASKFFTIVEHERGLDEGSLAMSAIIESGEAEFVMGDLHDETGKPTSNLERLFLPVDGGADYMRNMRAMTPTDELPAWPELRHDTSRGASAAGCIVVDSPYDDTRDAEGYRERMTDSRAKGTFGIWLSTPGQVIEANTSPLPPKAGSWFLDADGEEVELAFEDGVEAYDGDRLSLEATGDGYELRVGGDARKLIADELREELLGLTSCALSMDDITDSMEEFEVVKEAGRGTIAVTQSVTLRIGGTETDIEEDRVRCETVHQAAMMLISSFQDMYGSRPDRHEKLEKCYDAGVVEHAMEMGL